MTVELAMTADGALNLVNSDKNAVVIDVLRASSVMVTALNNGAQKIACFKTIEEAIRYKANNISENILLCGERNRIKPAGFDLGNSPIEYTNQAVAGKTIAITTTNGTQAVENAKTARTLYIMSFLNTHAVCGRLVSDNLPLVIICAGTAGRFTSDDFVCAGKAIHMLSSLTPVNLDDGAALALNYFLSGDKNVTELLKKSSSYKQVIEAGFPDDVLFCAKEDVYDIIPVYRDGFLVVQ